MLARELCKALGPDVGLMLTGVALLCRWHTTQGCGKGLCYQRVAAAQ